MVLIAVHFLLELHGDYLFRSDQKTEMARRKTVVWTILVGTTTRTVNSKHVSLHFVVSPMILTIWTAQSRNDGNRYNPGWQTGVPVQI